MDDILLPLSHEEAESLMWMILENDDPAFGAILRRLEGLLQDFEKEHEDQRKWVSNDFNSLTEYFGISNRCEVDEHPDGIHRHGLARYSKQAID